MGTKANVAKSNIVENSPSWQKKNKAEYEPEITSFHKKKRERECFYASTSILKGWLKVYTELSCGLLCMNCQNYQQRQRDSERTALAGFEGIFGIFMKKEKKKNISLTGL